tara:strand:+ start:3144 stop:3323 length:180 start_codon:yes stop_codon:yes gene_type:complete
MSSSLALQNMGRIIGAEVPTGVDISQLYADTYLHGGEEKIGIEKLEKATLPTLDAACSF